MFLLPFSEIPVFSHAALLMFGCLNTWKKKELLLDSLCSWCFFCKTIPIFCVLWQAAWQKWREEYWCRRDKNVSFSHRAGSSCLWPGICLWCTWQAHEHSGWRCFHILSYFQSKFVSEAKQACKWNVLAVTQPVNSGLKKRVCTGCMGIFKELLFIASYL